MAQTEISSGHVFIVILFYVIKTCGCFVVSLDSSFEMYIGLLHAIVSFVFVSTFSSCAIDV